MLYPLRHCVTDSGIDVSLSKLTLYLQIFTTSQVWFSSSPVHVTCCLTKCLQCAVEVDNLQRQTVAVVSMVVQRSPSP